MNIMFKLNKMLAAMMNGQTEYDVTMSETHHIHKLDSPSGTAVTLAEDIIGAVERKHSWVNSATDKADELSIISYREGEVPGIHTVTYDSQADTLELTHCAKSRRGLVLGAVLAAEFVLGKSGVFSMDDMLKF